MSISLAVLAFTESMRRERQDGQSLCTAWSYALINGIQEIEQVPGDDRGILVDRFLQWVCSCDGCGMPHAPFEPHFEAIDLDLFNNECHLCGGDGSCMGQCT